MNPDAVQAFVEEARLSHQLIDQLSIHLPDGQDIRLGRSPDRPELVKAYLDDADRLAGQLPRSVQRKAHMLCYQLLLETICDCCVPVHWRRLCMDHIYRPLLALGRLAKSIRDRQTVRRCYREVSVLSNYFL